jgi:hypothetical protein
MTLADDVARVVRFKFMPLACRKLSNLGGTSSMKRMTAPVSAAE